MMINRRFVTCGLALLIAAAIAGCGKDKFATKPSLKFKSVNTYNVPYGGLFEIRLEYTDAEGDLTADTGIIINRTVARCNNSGRTEVFRLPATNSGSNASGEIVIRYENGTLNATSLGYKPYTASTCASVANIDTTTFRFYIRDKAGNVSDTITTDKPLLIKRN